jgi:transposase
VFVGIDVSRDRLDVHLRPSGKAFAVSRDGPGIAELVERLGSISPALVVLEATGGFEITVAAGIAAAGLPLAVVNPAQIRATGRLAKTDRLDAAVIAHFAEAVRPEPRPLASEAAQGHGRSHRDPLEPAHPRDLYLRLRGRGRPAKAALVAAMRKLLSILNAILRDGTPWQNA